MGTTGNGKPWGENVGNLGQGFATGWSAYKGVKGGQAVYAETGDWETAAWWGLKAFIAWMFLIGTSITFVTTSTSIVMVPITRFIDPKYAGQFNHPQYWIYAAMAGPLFLGINFLCWCALWARVCRVSRRNPQRGTPFDKAFDIGARAMHYKLFPSSYVALWLVPMFLTSFYFLAFLPR